LRGYNRLPRGRSSVGRASASQAEGRGFEPHRPLLIGRDGAEHARRGYLFGPRIGAAAYDFGHLEAFPIALAVVGVLTDSDVCLKLALIWLAHIGMDRAVGYGLKYPTHHKDTHLQRV
jgi:hypothetical protein